MPKYTMASRNSSYRAFAESKRTSIMTLEECAANVLGQWGDATAAQFAHQDKLQTTGEWDRQAAFWKARLAGAPAILDLPADRPRPVVRDHAAAHLSFGLGRPASATIAAFARRAGITSFAFLLAVSVTSGVRDGGQGRSTGPALALSVPHRAVMRLVQNPSYLRLGPDERMLRLSPLTFDAATLEIWGRCSPARRWRSILRARHRQRSSPPLWPNAA